MHVLWSLSGEGGILATAEELERLEAILASFPTTEEEDARLLQGARRPGPFVASQLPHILFSGHNTFTRAPRTCVMTHVGLEWA